MKNRKYLQYNIGDPTLCNHIDAVHAKSPNSDQYTGVIVLGVIKKINASGIIATISRDFMDINRPRNAENAPAIDEYRNTIKEIITSKKILDKNNKLNKNYLHLAIHGMKNDWETEFEIGTRRGNSCSKEIVGWFMNSLKVLSKNVRLDNVFQGDQSKEYHRNGDDTSNYDGYGQRFNTIQIEINKDWRKNKQYNLINFFSELLIHFDKKFNI